MARTSDRDLRSGSVGARSGGIDPAPPAAIGETAGRPEGTRNAETAEDAAVFLDRLATAIRARVAGRHEAEMRLASFAFAEKPAGDRSGWAAAGGEAAPDMGYFVRRALAALGDPDAARILNALRQADRPLGALMGLFEPAVHDRLVAGDLVGSLASAGLVGRDLESDRVALTALGIALLDLVADLERRARSLPTP